MLWLWSAAMPGTNQLTARSTPCYGIAVARSITQRELRNESGQIMQAVDQGERFVVTRNGVPVAELVPLRRRRFVSADHAVAAFAGAPPVNLDALRADLDAIADPDAMPRG